MNDVRTTKQLVGENNDKRKRLSTDNNRLYDDFLIYLRTDLRIAEHDTEEVLMDLLDHLLEGQEEGKRLKIYLALIRKIMRRN